MTIRAILFDFGGVLYNTPDRRWMQQWQNRLGLAKDELISSIVASPEESPYVQAIMEGRIPENDMWSKLAQRWRLSPLLVRWLKRSTMNRKRLNTAVVSFLGGLRPAYRTGILSNAGSEARQTFIATFGFDRLVDEMIISAEEGVAKPDPRIYRIALERMGTEAQETVLVDDLAVNVEAARLFGMHAVQFVNAPQALAEVRAILA